MGRARTSQTPGMGRRGARRRTVLLPLPAVKGGTAQAPPHWDTLQTCSECSSGQPSAVRGVRVSVTT